MNETITIDGEMREIQKVHDWGYLPMIETDNGDYYLAENSGHAGEQARKYWETLAQDDPEELSAIIGTETLISWGLNQYAGPGYSKVRSLQGWLDLWLDTPEEHFAGYDGEECDIDAICGIDLDTLEFFISYNTGEEGDDFDPALVEACRLAVDITDEIGFVPTVAYRCN